MPARKQPNEKKVYGMWMPEENVLDIIAKRIKLAVEHECDPCRKKVGGASKSRLFYAHATMMYNF
ncbi:MAG TPA: hypothetical protein VFE58_01960 [Tepidisphaeraceae bacterium]|jgi:hypothetical protein|nr:hypothetical protein [Tepidisphaeraceae bacterium]